jgi:hypothetical protein
LEDGRGGLVFEVGLDEGGLNLMLEGLIRRRRYLEETFLLAAGNEPVVEGLVKKFVVGAVD